MDESFVKTVKRIARENTLILSIVGLILGVLFLVIGILGFNPDLELMYLSDFVSSIGNWFWWFLILSLFILLPASSWFLYVNITDRRRFGELIDTSSKKVFVSNMDELEELAFRLGVEYQEELYDKKRELKVK